MSKQERVEGVMLVPTPMCSACFDFTTDGNNYEKRTIVIVPIVIDEKSSGLFQVSWACSRGVNCVDRSCRYSYSKKRKYANEETDIQHLGSFGDR